MFFSWTSKKRRGSGALCRRRLLVDLLDTPIVARGQVGSGVPEQVDEHAEGQEHGANGCGQEVERTESEGNKELCNNLHDDLLED